MDYKFVVHFKLGPFLYRFTELPHMVHTDMPPPEIYAKQRKDI